MAVRPRRANNGRRDWIKYIVGAVLVIAFLFYRHKEQAAELFSTKSPADPAGLESTDAGSASLDALTSAPVPGDNIEQVTPSAEEADNQDNAGGNKGGEESRGEDGVGTAADEGRGNGEAAAGDGRGQQTEVSTQQDATPQKSAPSQEPVPGQVSPQLQRYVTGPFVDLVNRVMERQLKKLEQLAAVTLPAEGGGDSSREAPVDNNVDASRQPAPQVEDAPTERVPEGGGGLDAVPDHNVARRWHSPQCQDFYRDTVPRSATRQPSRRKPRDDLSDALGSTAGWRPTGGLLDAPQPLARAVTWEDAHVLDPSWNVGPFYELPLYLGTPMRQVPLYSPLPFVWSSSVRMPFIGPPLRFYPPYPIHNLIEQLGHTLGPVGDQQFRKPLKTSFSIRDLDAHKVVAFVQHPVDRFFNAYIGLWRMLRSPEFLSPEVRAALETHTTFFGMQSEPERFRAFAKDVHAGKWMVGGEDVLSQAYYLAGTDRDGVPLRYDLIGKLDKMADSWHELEQLVGALKPAHISRGQLGLLSFSVGNKTKHPWFDPATLRIVCEVYAQDFVCFDYARPAVCEDG